jgi:hypothetical protein
MRSKKARSASNRKYRLAHLEELREYDRLRWPERREEQLIYNHAWRAENQQIITIQDRHKHVSQHWSLRLEVLSQYGNLCACCGEDNPYFLQIDHLLTCGNQHRKLLSSMGINSMYRFLKKEGFPEGYRVLCANCNMSYGMYGYCPHSSATPPPSTLTPRQMVCQRYHQKLRRQVIELYGGACQCCQETCLQFLTIDHVKGGGGKHRKSMTGNYYLSIIRRGYCKDFRVLCANCNASFGLFGFCRHQGKGKQLALL